MKKIILILALFFGIGSSAFATPYTDPLSPQVPNTYVTLCDTTLGCGAGTSQIFFTTDLNLSSLAYEQTIGSQWAQAEEISMYLLGCNNTIPGNNCDSFSSLFNSPADIMADPGYTGYYIFTYADEVIPATTKIIPTETNVFVSLGTVSSSAFSGILPYLYLICGVVLAFYLIETLKFWLSDLPERKEKLDKKDRGVIKY